MSVITKDIKKFNNVNKVDDSIKAKLISVVAENIVSTFAEHKISYENIYNTLSKVKLYTADMKSDSDSGILDKYFPYTNTIYVNSGIFEKAISDYNIENIDIGLIHEFIHCLQVQRNKNEITRIGMYDLSSKFGLGMNEAATQYIASNVCGNYFSHVKYFNLDFLTISENYYPIETAIIYQMSFFTGSFPLVSSALFGDSLFKNTFVEQTSKATYDKIVSSVDHIIGIQNQLSHEYIFLANSNLTEKSKIKKLNSIKENKEALKKVILDIQKTIYTESFNSMLKKVETLSDVRNMQIALAKFENLIIISEDDYSYDQFKDLMMAKLKKRFAKIQKFGKYNFAKRSKVEVSMLPAVKKVSAFKMFLNKLKLLFELKTNYRKGYNPLIDNIM